MPLQRLPAKLTVLRDTREKLPLVFPQNLRWYRGNRPHLLPVTVQRCHLPTADYTLEGFSQYVLVERKGSMSELVQNFFGLKDSGRFRRCLQRLSREATHPAFLLDFPLAEAFRSSSRVRFPDSVLDKVFATCLEYRVTPLWFPTGRNSKTAHRAGELTLRWMWQCVRYELERTA